MRGFQKRRFPITVHWEKRVLRRYNDKNDGSKRKKGFLKNFRCFNDLKKYRSYRYIVEIVDLVFLQKKLILIVVFRQLLRFLGYRK